MNPQKVLTISKDDLKTRLDMIIQEIPHFWEQVPYTHFTNHGPSHSERVHRDKLAQLAQELPEDQRLTDDEIFIVSAAAWLYEIGMQSLKLRPVLDFDYRPGQSLSFSQLQQIREKKHLLTYNLIFDHIRGDYRGPSLGLLSTADEYTELIAEVCRWCSDEPLERVEEEVPIGGVPVRVRLLVALLRLADQLYIDSSRVNLDRLQAADPPPRIMARWWIYHYAQTLPIEKGKIRFHYFLPITQQQYLGHIRALIEPNFEYENNPTIRYLDEYHGITLLLNRDPSIRYDKQASFRREMNFHLITYLREKVEPVQTEKSIPVPVEPDERCLLVLDYENLILQLGQEGHFFSHDKIGELLVTLLTEARMRHEVSTVDGLAVGHWHRPDLAETAEMLKQRVYDPLPIDDYETSSEKLTRELTQRLQSIDAPKQIVLVAPPPDLAPTVKQLTERRKSVNAWISNTPEAGIFSAVAQQFKLLSQLIGLPPANPISRDELELSQAACILIVDDNLASTGAEGISIEEVSGLLEHLELINGRGDWWRLWLINQQILIPSKVDGQYLLNLNSEHPSVVDVQQKRRFVIEAMQSLDQDDRGVPEDTLVKELNTVSHLRKDTTSFLELLKETDTLHRSYSPQDQSPLWLLNRSNWAVVALNADHYLSLLVLAIDHFLVREGFPFIHKHNLVGKQLAPYVGESLAEVVYQLAVKKEWVERETSAQRHRFRDEPLVNVKLVDSHPQVRKVLLNRDIMLDILSRRANENGLEREALWRELEKIPRFTLKQDKVNQWLEHLGREAIVTIQVDGQHIGRDRIKLNVESTLTRHLRGRLNVHGLVKTLRVMGAAQPQGKQPSGRVVGNLTRHVTRGDKKLAGWTLDYGKHIKLVGVEKQQSENNTTDFVYLKYHSFVRQLDQREQLICQAIAELVPKLSRRSSGGWVPRYVIIREMEKDSETFGYTREENNYWLDQAIYRLKLLGNKTERKKQGRPEEFIRALRQNHE